VNTVKGLVASRSQMLPEIWAFYHPTAGAMFDVAVTVPIMFRLFQDSRMNGVDLSGKSHPPTRWRQMQILNMMGITSINSGKLAYRARFGRVHRGDCRCGRGLRTDGRDEAAGPWVAHSWHGEGWEYATKVAERWNNTVRPKVAKYAYIEPNSYCFDLPKY
jgi:hypothetical protein